MIEEGYKGRAKYWGSYEVLKVAKLPKPIPLHSDELGHVLFKPTLVKIRWETGDEEFWSCPYWIVREGKERFAQYASMLSEHDLGELLSEAIKQNFFSKRFLSRLAKVIKEKL